MEEFTAVGAVTDFAPSQMKEITVKGRLLLIARIGEKYYATEGRCPHMGGILANGSLSGTVVTCPRHGSQFDLTDGRNIRWTRYTGLMQVFIKLAKSPRGLKTYAVKVDGGKILVKL